MADENALIQATPRDPNRRQKTNITELIAPAVLAMPKPLRERWVAALTPSSSTSA